jgi:hypothetical protein
MLDANTQNSSHIPGKESFIDDLRLLFEHFLLIITSGMSTTIRYRLNATINITCGPRHLEEPRAHMNIQKQYWFYEYVLKHLRRSLHYIRRE